MRTICRSVVLLIACLWLLLGSVQAQSTDSAAPLPVRSNEVSATIAARDVGDARLTDHFYAFTGTPGDLLITVDSRNMNGDVDVFTASGLRPLLKFTIYEGATGPITKSVYLRQRVDLILRVEARTPNDDEAVYRIHFGGAFEPIAGGPLLSENENNPTEPSVTAARGAKKGRRVSSAGARIEEPPEPTVAAAPTPEPTPAPPAEETKPAPTRTTRNPRNRRGARGTARTPATKPAEPAETATTESAATTPGETPAEPAAEAKPTPRRRGSRRGATATAPKTETAPEPAANTGPRLLIETDDGTLIEHYMSSVRRVTVENGVVVVVGKDGKVQRVLLANVVRMLIAP
ncbi:MAG TPA: hypothetical protein VHR36_14085 [Pyrinomonadaceae bacterium]|nr:hypothetical protein [Pyrinomonadaceae bacterium]